MGTGKPPSGQRGAGKGGRRRSGHRPPESWGFAAPLPPAAVSVQRTLRSRSRPLLRPLQGPCPPPSQPTRPVTGRRRAAGLVYSTLTPEAGPALVPAPPTPPGGGGCGAGAAFSEAGGWRRGIPVPRAHRGSLQVSRAWRGRGAPLPPNPREAQVATESCRSRLAAGALLGTSTRHPRGRTPAGGRGGSGLAPSLHARGPPGMALPR